MKFSKEFLIGNFYFEGKINISKTKQEKASNINLPIENQIKLRKIRIVLIYFFNNFYWFMNNRKIEFIGEKIFSSRGILSLLKVCYATGFRGLGFFFRLQ